MSFDYICVLDLETTGDSENYDRILELGMILTDRTLQPIGEFSSVVRCTQARELIKHEVVRRMHENSGLLLQSINALSRNHEVENNALDFLDKFTGNVHSVGDKPIALAGSGVSHFDRRFLKALMPRLEARFTYYTLDVGVLRRMFKLFCPSLLTDLSNIKPHRALTDAKIHLRELQYYGQKLAQLGVAP